MKLLNHEFNRPNIETLVLPRGDGEPIVFRAQAVLNFDEFDRLCPLPKPPQIKHATRGLIENYEDATYLVSVQTHGNSKMAWLILKSLEATEGLEWDTVDMKKPNTWENYEKELEEAFFSTTEIMRIKNIVFSANSLNEARIEEARKNFLLTQGTAPAGTSGPREEPNSTQSGKPATISE